MVEISALRLPLLLDGYHTHAALDAALRELAARDADRAAVSSIGKSGEGRPILLLTLGRKELCDTKPALLVLGSPHGQELLGQEAALESARAILAPEHAALLEKRTVYVIPQPNPDAAERSLARPFSPQVGPPLPPWDDDGDHVADEDPPRDLDGDGLVLWMRARDPRGTWLVDPDAHAVGDDRYLRPADPERGERGVWRVFREGLDADGDEAFAEDGPGGIDIDKSFPMFYRPFHRERAAGPYQLATPEARALADFFVARKNLAAARIFHTAGGRGVMGDDPHPLSSGEGGDLPAPDKKLYEDLEKAYRDTPGHKDAAGAFDRPGGSQAPGSIQDHAVFALGLVSFSHHLWDRAPGYEPNPNTPTARADEKLQWLRWSDRELGGAGFVAWRPFKHPTLGDVEIGGWAPQTRETPPPTHVADIALREAPFTIALLERLPEIEIQSLTTTAAGDGLFEVKAAIANAGALPTATELARRARQAPDPVVEIALPEGAALVFGKQRQQVPHLAGGGGRVEVRWVVKAAAGAGVTVRVTTTRAGSAERRVTLEEKRRF